MANYKIGFIGVGSMGGAILRGIIAKGAINAKNICAFDKSQKGKETAQEAGVHLASGIQETAEFSDIIILAVKPKDSLDAIKTAGNGLQNKALLSIVAGLDYKTIYAALGEIKTRVLVILPNTPAMVGQGAAGFTLETTFTQDEKTFAEKLFLSIGIVEWISEKLLFAVSALSGSGPAYTAIFIEALADAAVLEGLPRDTAYRLAAATVAGTGRLVLESGLHPAIIKDNVCSPGGTTIEGVKALENGNFRASVMSAVGNAAAKFFKLIGIGI